MKTAKKLSVVFGLLGVLLLAAAVALSVFSLDATAKILFVPRAAQHRTEVYMDALCRADFETMGSMMYGQPQLAADSEMDSELASYLWDAYTDSISYEFSGSCYASASGISQDVQVTVLDISGILSLLKERSQDLLEQRAAVTDGDLVFDENDQYREEFAMSVLYEGAKEILEEVSISKCIDLTLELTCQDGQWYILPNPVITDILTGSISG